MRILLVTHGLPPQRIGGTESYAYYLARELAQPQREHEVGVFLPNREEAGEEFSLVRRSIDGIDRWEALHRYETESDFEHHFRQPKLDAPFQACLEEFKPEVVHFLYFLGGLSSTLVANAKDFGARVLITLTDFNPICAWGQMIRPNGETCANPNLGLACVNCFFGADPYANAGAWKRIAVARKWRWPPEDHLNSPELTRMQDRLDTHFAALDAADRVIFPTEALQRRYEDAGFWMDSVTRMPFAVDLGPFEALEPPQPDESFTLGFVGQLSPHKGLDLLLRALEGMEGVRLAVWGNLEQEGAREYVESRCGGLAQPWVDFRGLFRLEEVGAVYGSIDALAIPSIWMENSPLALLYALAAGRPAIVSDFGGLSPFITPGETGILAGPRDEANWRRAIAHLIQTRDQFCRPETVRIQRERFGIAGHVDKVSELYRGAEPPRDFVGLD